jgi:hypothetical protein
VVWLLTIAEDLIRGENLREFYRTLRVGSTAYIVQRRANSHERFLEVSEYRTGGLRSFIIIPEGREGNGPGNCVVQFFFFFIRAISLKNAKRNHVHMEYTR